LPETLSIGLGGAAALIAAFTGLGVYSLVLWSLGSALVSSLTAWWVVQQRPRFARPDPDATRRLASTTASIGAGDMALYVRLSSDYALTGRLLGTGPLGVYSVAWGTSAGPLLVIHAFTGRVGFAVYSLLQHEPEQLKRVFLSAVRIVMAAGMPVMLGAIIVAPDLVPVTLGSKWSAAVVPVMILFVVQLLRTVGGQGASVMLAMGRTRLYAIIGLAAIPVTIVAIFLGTRAGVTGVAWAMLVAVGGASLVYLVVGMRLLHVRPREMLEALAIPTLLTCVSLPAVALTRALLLWGWDAPVVLRLAASILAGALAAYLLLRRLWPALRADFWQVRHAVPAIGE
jgi:O-antigen/teichoic acid export membrane protein